MSEAAKARCTPEWRLKQSIEKRAIVDEVGIVKAYVSGGSQEDVSRSFRVSRKVIANVLKRNGIKCRAKVKRNQWGSNNARWRGCDASLVSKHKRLYRLLGQPSRCDECGTTDTSLTYDWANLTGNYDDASDFKRMCRSCHWKYDKKHLNLNGKR